MAALAAARSVVLHVRPHPAGPLSVRGSLVPMVTADDRGYAPAVFRLFICFGASCRSPHEHFAPEGDTFSHRLALEWRGETIGSRRDALKRARKVATALREAEREPHAPLRAVRWAEVIRRGG